MNELIIQELREKHSVRKHWPGYILHNFIVKKLFRKSSINLQNKILDLIVGNPETVLDVSSGDDDLILKIWGKFETKTCIANDISPQLSTFAQGENKEIIRTSFNILSQPFNQKFDLVIFKNTLHHIPRNYQNKLINYLLQIANQLIVVDIENPHETNFRAKLWNRYYKILLGDTGDYFLNFECFKKLLSSCNSKFKFGRISTIKGNYQYGVYIKDLISDSNLIQSSDEPVKAQSTSLVNR